MDNLIKGRVQILSIQVGCVVSVMNRLSPLPTYFLHVVVPTRFG